MYFAHKQGPRAEYREKQHQRVVTSQCLSEKYHELKSLTVNAEYYAPKGLTQYRQLTYDVNLSHAKSVFRLDCCNEECVQGDHELTAELSKSITKHSKTIVGELCCKGWQNKALVKKTKCNHVLRYKLKLGY